LPLWRLRAALLADEDGLGSFAHSEVIMPRLTPGPAGGSHSIPAAPGVSPNIRRQPGGAGISRQREGLQR
jgi:hypothetical protein